MGATRCTARKDASHSTARGAAAAANDTETNFLSKDARADASGSPDAFANPSRIRSARASTIPRVSPGVPSGVPSGLPRGGG